MVEMRLNDGSCVELKEAFNRSWAGKIQNVDLALGPLSRKERKQWFSQ